MSDSGKQVGDCKHGYPLGYCILCLRAVILECHSQKADDRCWMDISKVYEAAGLPSPDNSVGDKPAMRKNCDRFIDVYCISGTWKSYAELKRENGELREKVRLLKSELRKVLNSAD